AGTTPQPVAYMSACGIPGGPFPFSSLGPLLLNQAGKVAFFAQDLVSGLRNGLYLGAPGTAAVKVMRFGDPGPAGTTFSQVTNGSVFSLNNSGEVAFQVSLNPTGSAGVFIGTAAGPPT